MSSKPVRLWSDEPSPVDLLAFVAVAETAVEAVLDDALDPIALGISGPWGSGKSTVLKLIQAELASRSVANAEEQILVVETDPWRYDPDFGAKATLILEVLNALTGELQKREGVTPDVEGTLKKLAKRVNWVKALKLAARSSITLQLPGIDDLSGLVNEGDLEGDPEPRNLDEFRQDFAELLANEQLGHVRRVVVLVDDLDRCLSDTVVDTLETMRLFLSVPKMSFVIAADEDRVADALRERYPEANGSAEDTEEPARLYLHKIVQTTLRLPALSRFDTEAYLLLLLLQSKVEDENRHGLAVGGGGVTIASGTAEREAALDLIDRHRPLESRGGRRRITVGGDKGFDVADFVEELRHRKVTPHIAVQDHVTKTGKRRKTKIDGRTRRAIPVTASANVAASASRRSSAGSRRARD